MTFRELALKNVWRDKWTYLAYFLSSMFSVLLFFLFSVSMFHPSLNLIADGSALALAMAVGNILIYLFSFIFIAYSIGAFLKNKEKTLGIFIITGASKKQIGRLIFLENIFIGLAAILAGIILGMAIAPLSLMLSSYILGVDDFRMYLPIKAVFLTSILFFALFFLISILSPIFVRKESLMKLLKSDRMDEKEEKISRFLILLGSLSMLSLLGMAFWGKFETLLAHTGGFLLVILLALPSLYLLIVLMGRMVLAIISKSSSYYRRTNMLLVAELRAKFKTNTNVIFAVTVLLVAVFSATTLLYGVRKDVEAKTLESYPFSYIYLTDSDTPRADEKATFLQEALSEKEGYAGIRLDILTPKQEGYSRDALVAERDYNKAASLLGLELLDLADGEIYQVAGNKMGPKNLENNPTFRALSDNYGAFLSLAGESSRLVTPEGYYDKLLVLEDAFFDGLDRLDFDWAQMNAFNISNWKEEQDLSSELMDMVTDGGLNRVGFFSAANLYETERITKTLILYIGGVLSVIFLLASASMIYFRLITEKEREALKYRNLMRIGLSRKEFARIQYRIVGVLMYVPFFLASFFLLGQTLLLKYKMNLDYRGIASISFVLFLLIQSLGYFLTVSNYKKAILKQIDSGSSNF